MRRRLAFATALLLACLGSSPTWAQIADWTGGGATDRWDEKGNWSGGDIPDTSGETSRFSVAGSFPVELPASFTVNDFTATAGLPQLRPTAGVNPTITVSDDLIINNNGGLFLSAPGGEKLTIDIDDELRLDGGGGLTVDTSAAGTVTILTSDLRLADLGTGSGTINLIGPNTLFEQDGFSIINIGQDGPAQFTLSDRARATFTSPLQLVNFADPGSTASALVESGSRLTLNSLQIAPGGFNAGVNGSLTVTGNNSVATTTSVTSIGGSSTPTGSLSVTAGGRYDSGGATTINASGTLTVDDGTYNANDTMTLSGGKLTVADGQLNATAGLETWMGTLEHTGGTIRVTGGAYAPAEDADFSSSYTIDGANAPAVELGAGARMFGPTLYTDLFVGRYAQGSLQIDSGAISNPQTVYVGHFEGSDGSIRVVDNGSQLGVSTLYVGRNGQGSLSVEDGGAAFAFSLLRIANEENSVGEVMVTGPGSLLSTGSSTSASIHVGVNGAGQLDVTNQGLVQTAHLYVGSFDAGARTGSGAVVIDDASVSVNNTLRIGRIGPATIDVLNGGDLSAAVQVIFGPQGVVTIDGSTFSAGSVIDEGGRLLLKNGTLNFESPNQPLIVGPVGMSVGGVAIEQDNTVSVTTLFSNESITTAGDIVFAPGGSLLLNGGQLVGRRLLLSTGATLYNVSAAELPAPAPLQMALGSTIEVRGDVSLGDASATDGVVVGGKLDVNNHDVTLLDANDAVLDSGALVELGFGAGWGKLIAPNGLTIDFGANVTDEGFGTIETPDDPTKPLVNNGHIAADSIASPITLTGYVKGVGTCDNCVITGTDAPGFSPATVVRGSVAYRGVLEIEIGGTGSGDFDRLEHLLGAGVADLGGELQIESIDGYGFASGDAFEFLTADGGVAGVFATESLPTLGGGLGLDVLYSANSVTLAVVGIEGDYNYDGQVDAADYTVWRDSEGQSGAGLAADGNGDGMINGLDYDLWVSNYGSTLPATSKTVPEPSSSCLVLAALYCRLFRRR